MKKSDFYIEEAIMADPPVPLRGHASFVKLTCCSCHFDE